MAETYRSPIGREPRLARSTRFISRLVGAALLLGTAFWPATEAIPALGDRVTTNLVVLYPMNDGLGTTVRDQSNNGPRMDLELSGATSWLPGQNGLTFAGGRALTAGPATKVISALQASGEATFELWLEPANLTQDGPARFLSIATDTSDRNLNLGQTQGDLQLRLLHTGKDSKGRPFLTTTDGFLGTTLIHLVVTFDGATEAIWVDSIQHPDSQSVAGNFSGWNAANPMAIASEVTGSREWLGDIRLVAIYDRALTPGEILQNFNAGADVGPLPQVDAGPDKETSPGLPGFTYSALLEGELLDNGLADPNVPITTSWTTIDGPGVVTFVDPAQPRTMADFSTEGIYTLRLLADNGESIGSDDVVVTVNMVSPTLVATNLEPPDGATGVSPTPTLELSCPATLPEEGQMM
ncbi:MAG: LamG domain-containing protein, partial [Acidimicrobiia bacterium]|nr:LamG domain-containing protein [Acidimicrobiia bacterium]